MKELLVSCVIPTYKQMDYLFGALDSVLMQDYKLIEIIVADDGSDNFDKEIIKDYIEIHKNSNIVGYNVIHNPHNLGTVKNLNRAIVEANGDIIAVLASDDQLYDDEVLTKVCKVFTKKQCQIVTCSRVKYDDTLLNAIRMMPHPKYISYITNTLNTPHRKYRFMALGSEMEFASGAALYYTKEYFMSVKGYDERYLLWEDGPFIARALRRGTVIECAYDINAVKYRDGGISSKGPKSPTQLLIAKDYSNFYRWEFYDHPEQLSRIRRDIAFGIGCLYESDKVASLRSLYFGTLGRIGILVTKIVKFRLRYLSRL